MRSREFIPEFSTIDRNIVTYLQNKGYKRLGAGVDQTAFLEPGTGHVLKVFGTQCTGNDKTPRLSQDQKMFKIYADFCARNQNNPYLPRIYGWETFVYPTHWRTGDREQRCLYLQIRTEPLRHFSDRWAVLFSDMAQAVAYGGDFRTFHEDMETGDVYDVDENWYQSITNNPQSIKRLSDLFNTMKSLYALGKARGYEWDLHGNNIMKRSDGTPVITDPWVIN